MANKNMEKKIDKWTGDADFSDKNQKDTKSQYESYTKSYMQKFKRVNVYNEVYEKFKDVVQEQHGFSIVDATTYILLDFLDRENPGDDLEFFRRRYFSKMRRITKK